MFVGLGGGGKVNVPTFDAESKSDEKFPMLGEGAV